MPVKRHIQSYKNEYEITIEYVSEFFNSIASTLNAQMDLFLINQLLVHWWDQTP